MIKKFQILFILVMFFGSTTSLPITIHLCKMMDSNSKNSCKMHMTKKMNSNHCPMKTSTEKENSQTIKIPFCCSSIAKNLNIKDDYVLTQSVTSKDLKIKLLSNISHTNTFDTNILEHIQTNKAPPKTANNKIFLTFSLLLI